MAPLLVIPDGTVSYDVHGPADGPTVVLVPGLGDLRSSWRDLVGPLVDAGHRVVTTDVRGHGDGTHGFTRHGVEPTADDVRELLDTLDVDAEHPAVLVGASFAAGAVARVAAQDPDRVRGVVLVAYAGNGEPAGRSVRLQIRLLLARPWGPRAWTGFYRSLLRGRKAAWTDAHLADLRRALRDPAALADVRALALALVGGGHRTLLGQVTRPVLVVTGTLDPEHPDPTAAHAATMAAVPHDAVTGVLVPEAGHYPQHQRPDVVVPALLDFLAGLTTRGDVTRGGVA
ncbi:alpha/beta hydrolase fold protein [Cellulomonas flavigena DSM 20109]|uniref:Alpha/beta hydrolase fold protein n=1 Tax=Cellulomonas flavigena (strain ATCC 482 / DSM 20109 / BCRC 11376 / JCM 18109 / NBRC 3775 / NCIMB 8073 / NRS 134) TaxID=446466 RepID=D5UKL8_CELFN|nr:alpha/beta hydrolase [Cellulomonas flavigena]ADG73836.1 alpha/beta hydrolase fold protein [Cellulomonas flavigena DSM 20109]